MDGSSTASMLQTHYEEEVYFLPLSFSFLTCGRIRKCLKLLQNILAFSPICHPQGEMSMQQKIFLHIITIHITVSCPNKVICAVIF